MRCLTGRFKPRNPQKYVGDVNNIIYRSSLELRFLRWLDSTPSVLNFNSEELAIPYFCPTDKQVHRYFPDMIVKIRKSDNKEQVFMVEIKPDYQTREPTPKKNQKTFLLETLTWVKNKAKWSAAIEYCKARDWEFKLITDKDLTHF